MDRDFLVSTNLLRQSILGQNDLRGPRYDLGTALRYRVVERLRQQARKPDSSDALAILQLEDDAPCL